jgi:tetratricopeptide (TPR) repeat protein
MNETITPQQLKEEGEAAYRQGNYIAAAHAYEASAQGYRATDNELAAAEMLNNSSVAFLQAGEAQRALEIVNETPETFSKAGDTRRQGMAFGNQGAALEALKRYPEAIEAYQRSAELLKQAGEGELRANVLQSLSALLLKSGQQLEALAVMQAGLEGVKRPNPKQRILKKLLHVPFKFLEKK